ncbi:MAG: hypothetical protein ACOYXT_13630 [Bacteroidota bacterium]
MKPAALGGSNMLTQDAATYLYKVERPNDQLPFSNTNHRPVGLVSATIQTWSNQIPVVAVGVQTGIWRKHASYSFIGNNGVELGIDGLYPLPTFQLPLFNNWTSPPDQVSAEWQLGSAVTLYDAQSRTLEAKDLNNKFVATKTSSDQSYVVATVANAQYGEFGYSGAEDKEVSGYYGGGISRVDGQEVYRLNLDDKATTHTGEKALALNSPGTKAFRFSLNAVKDQGYHASVWVNSTGGRIFYSLNGVTQQAPEVPQANRKAGAWYLLSTDITVGQNGTLEMWCETAGGTCHFDDFRVHPHDASMNSYVYNTWGELSHILDNNNLYTEFRYDGIGRLHETYLESFQSSYGIGGVAKVNQIDYHYGPDQPITFTLTASKSGTGQISPAGTITISAGESYTFQAQEVCTDKFNRWLVDGSVVDPSQTKLTLFDGTIVNISGKVVTFRNVQSAHSIKAEFYQVPLTGMDVRCHFDGTCFNGMYDYYTTVDACGNPVWVENKTWASVPQAIKDIRVQQNCCTNGNQNCSCTPPGQGPQQ